MTSLQAMAPNAPLNSGPVVDVVVPVYNEAHVLRSSITQLCEYLDAQFPFTWRVTIADNASTDGTLAVAHELAEARDEVTVLHLTEKGRGRALRTAWLASDAQVTAYMDVDLSTGLSGLLPLVAPLISGHSDLAVGSRLSACSAVARGPQREFISRVYNRMLRFVFLNRFRDAQCGFKAIRSDIGQRLLPAVRDNAWFFDTELLLLAEHNGLRVHEVPVDWIDDPDTRVHIGSTVRQDLRGMWRMFCVFLKGEGIIDLGELARPKLADDFGRQLVLFAFVGLASTASSLTLFLLLRSAVGSVGANLLALTATTLANTWAHRRYTFGEHGRSDRSRQYTGAIAVWLLGAIISSLAIGLVAQATDSLGIQLIALLGAWSTMAVVRFALLRSWVFRRRNQPQGVDRTRLKARDQSPQQ